ncbi:hypothetical protein P3342_011280 [Pyrenophora teres f. teres]|nr:hypothetical protein P3342_011280 [Pyrenophora teres f. teres]
MVHDSIPPAGSAPAPDPIQSSASTGQSLRNITNPKALRKFMKVFSTLLIIFASLLWLIEDDPVHTSILPWPWGLLHGEDFLLMTMFLWIVRLIYHFSGFPPTSRPSRWYRVCLFWHMVPVICIWLSARKVRIAKDPKLVWFASVVFYRYWRTFVGLVFMTKDTPAQWIAIGKDPKYFPSDCTVIVPTKGPGKTPEAVALFRRMVIGVLQNKPKCIIFSAPNSMAVLNIRKQVAEATAKLPDYRSNTEVKYTSEADVMNKRHQAVAAWSIVKTKIVVNADDTAIWESPRLLEFAVRPFNDMTVGLVGTTKWVERVQGNSFWAGFWNMAGNNYLSRHNFEIIASFLGDGGIFCVSGRSNLVRTNIVQDKRFQEKFLEEYVWGSFFAWLEWLGQWISGFRSLLNILCKKFDCITPRGIGPVKADDDNFITRWVINEGWNIAVESSPETTITTQLGGMESSGILPSKYIGQCIRWSRTTIRQNPEALFSDLTIWMKWPITTWMTYIAWLHNAALFWDFAIVWTFSQTMFYKLSSYRPWLMVFLNLALWLSKLIKTIPWYRKYPKDIRYFPLQVAFSYCHTFIKVYTYFTCGDLSWTGREKEIKESEQEKEKDESGEDNKKEN